MPRILAIDWDRREARGLLISSGPTGSSVAGAWAVSLSTADSAGLTGKQIGSRLAAAMSGKVDGKVTTLVGVGRDNVQVQLLTLPPAPADELPDMVRFQADRDFTALGNEAALDFVPISGDAQTPNQVLAVALNSSGVVEARDVCEAIGVEPDRIPLRACAAAALVHRAGLIDSEHVALVVNPLTDEADLTVQAGDKVVLMRTVRLPDPSHGEGRHRALVGEIRRTMAAVRQQLADRKVEQVIVCGNKESLEPESDLTAELDVPVTAFDISSQAPAGLANHNVSAEGLARFAAVLGMALNEADRRPPIVDFANIRRKAERRPFGRTHALAAAAAVIALLWLGTSMWRQLAGPANQVAEMEAEITGMQSQIDRFDEITAQADSIESWLATDVNWLDELEQFARRVRPTPLTDKNYPVNEDIVVTQVTMSRVGGMGAVGGQLALQAKAKNDAAVRDLEQRLRDDEHSVMPGSLQKDNALPGYSRALDLDIRVLPAEDEDAEPAEVIVEEEAGSKKSATEPETKSPPVGTKSSPPAAAAPKETPKTSEGPP
jgi:Tfp pilus assembly PilM family ATPase